MKTIEKRIAISLGYIFLILSAPRMFPQSHNSSQDVPKIKIQSSPRNMFAPGEANFRKDRIEIIDPNGVKWYPGKKADSDLIRKKNTIACGNIMGRLIGPLDAFNNGDIKIAWNYEGSIIYIQVLSPNMQTADGISIGDKRKKVRNILGNPTIQTDHEDRYDNDEYEVVGMMLEYDSEDSINCIILFVYD